MITGNVIVGHFSIAFFKRVFFNAVMENKRKIRLQQFMTVNAELMRTMLDMLEGNIETGYYFDLSKVKFKDRYEN